MNIRIATEADIPSIINVLKASLGEKSSKKTEAVWKFKHLENPFGKSLVLVAMEGNKIIGVRAFMMWNWQCGKKLYKAYRAVDTATHPDYQGKGVFKKLTLKAIDYGREKQGDFIFNTPNEQSLPGYLKMDWKKAGKISVQISPRISFQNFLKNNSIFYEENIISMDLDELCHLSIKSKEEKNVLFTPKSPEYLFWRYHKNPLQKYQIYSDKGLYIAGYVKRHKYFSELRIVEFLAADGIQEDLGKKIIKRWEKKIGINIISLAENLQLGGIKLKGQFGPLLVVRNLNLSNKIFSDLMNIESFSYSLGDLELF